MLYNKFQDLDISALGLGCMRLPVLDGDDTKIDEAATQEMVDYALANGINYFDTAYGYHGGNSEKVIGRCLAKHPRESYYISSKFPGYDLANFEKIEEIFNEQLERTGVGYFDFYMFHNVNEKNIDLYLNEEKYGLMAFLLEQKKQGRIRHLGFSTHAGIDTMQRFIEAYGEHMEFCLIQLNWLDWNLQNAMAKVNMLLALDLPILVMEPLRGGKLATLPEENAEILKALRPEETVPGWAFRFLQSVGGILVTLSGMSNFQQLQDNIRSYEEHKPLNMDEMETLFAIAEELAVSVPCTSCRYCTTYCPMELDIPKLINLYNDHVFTGKKASWIAPMNISLLPEDKRPASCIGCRACEAVCPQQIKISEVMSDFVEKLKK